MSLTIDIIAILEDNYAFLLVGANGQSAIIDPGEASPILRHANSKSIRISQILNTHHHWDHTDGNQEIHQATGATIISPLRESNRIKDVQVRLKDGDTIDLAGHDFKVIETAGHTDGHICLYCESEKVLFSGDTPFSMGCGRLFEGSANEMFDSMQKLKALPDDTLVYCGHEYTLSNARFAQHIEPDNQAIIMRHAEVQRLRADNKPTIPVLLGNEKETNPFLKAKSAEDFGALRILKDNF